ncbi:DNA-directed DNA polymerase [Haliangium ochraceum DSM 14365]|uniref:DNA polymerase beta n=2 Tax=Haliangium ochraceum TaxID=80816 RepID=D0LRS9_HALO1|nr:DNA-directed DNA polymerase [Haliangium ochraceum DSM 14365]
MLYNGAMAGERDDVVEHLRELVQLTVLDEQNPQSFRARAYESAIQGLSSHGDEIAQMSVRELKAIDGVGASTAAKIRELLDTGAIDKLEKLRAKYPPAFVELSRIPGLGPKTLMRLRGELDVHSVDDLRKALEAKKLRTLSGFGAKSEDNLRRAIERLGMSGKDRRTPIADALPIAQRITAALEALPEVERVSYCGSLRRFRETIGDIDIVVAAGDSAPVMEAFVALNVVAEVLARGDTKTSVLTREGLQIDLRVVAPAAFGAAILYFTGSRNHNIKLRQRALQRGATLNEYGLSDSDSGEVLASESEEAIYEALSLPWIPPPMREDSGEIEGAAAGTLPELVQLSDVLGDLHVHTALSGDGRSPLGDIVEAASGRGYGYLAITDHGEDLAINGVTRAQLRSQREELDRLGERYPDMRLLQGCELNIGPEGGLDYDLDFRMQLDWCVAAVHSHFDLDQATQTKRIIAAMEDPSVHAIAHLTGRRIGRRPGIELDIDAVLEAAAETGTAIEINSALGRLDVSADVLRRAQDPRVLFLIDTDAHHVSELERMAAGCQQATRGWVPRERVLNTWTREAFLDWVRARRER